MKRKTKRLLNEIVILLWPICASVISLYLKANFLGSTLLFFGVPAVYLSLLQPAKIKRASLFALASIPMTILLDYIMEVTGGWFVPHSVFGDFRLFGFVTVDILVWFFLYAYLIIMFYEAFLHDHCKNKAFYPFFKYLIFIVLFLFGVFLSLYMLKPDWLAIKHFYLWMGLVLGPGPIIFMLLRSPSLFTKLFKTGIYFFFLSLIYEVTALSLGQWSFPGKGQFVGSVSVFGQVLPFEELFFWIMLAAMSLISYYELYDDDGR